MTGHVLEVVLAKPQTEKKSDGGYSYNPGLHPNHIPHPGYGGGFSGNMYGNLGAGYGAAAGFQQVFHELQMIYLQINLLACNLFASHGLCVNSR